LARSDLILEDPSAVGIDPATLDALYARVEKAVGRHEGCAAQVALARGGRVAGFRAFGSARFAGELGAAERSSLFAVFSVTKAFVSSATWMLLGDGTLALEDRVVDHIPEFGRNGKQAVTVEHLLTHTAGLPSASLLPRVWLSEEQRLACFGDWKLEWEPGSRFTYHGSSTMWVLAQLVTRLTGTDYRDYIRRQIFEPLGLTDLFIGLPEEHHGRVADVVAVGVPLSQDQRAVASVDAPTLSDEMIAYFNEREARALGSPGGGGIGTAADVALFYQGVLACLDPNGGGPWDPASVADACTPRNLENNSARAIGHMGAGGQVAWGDPASGISFAFVTNGAERNAARQGANGIRLSSIAATALSPSGSSTSGGSVGPRVDPHDP
jgi:CubicO group peptidase (beta-lactamase class C family)